MFLVLIVIVYYWYAVYFAGRAQLLLEAGADINSTTKEGATALQMADTNAHVGVVALLTAALKKAGQVNPHGIQSNTYRTLMEY